MISHIFHTQNRDDCNTTQTEITCLFLRFNPRRAEALDWVTNETPYTYVLTYLSQMRASERDYISFCPATRCAPPELHHNLQATYRQPRQFPMIVLPSFNHSYFAKPCLPSYCEYRTRPPNEVSCRQDAPMPRLWPMRPLKKAVMVPLRLYETVKHDYRRFTSTRTHDSYALILKALLNQATHHTRNRREIIVRVGALRTCAHSRARTHIPRPALLTLP
jgi:hypothetical protein